MNIFWKKIYKERLLSNILGELFIIVEIIVFLYYFGNVRNDIKEV